MTNNELKIKYKHLFYESGGFIETSEQWSGIVENMLGRLDWVRTHNLHLNDNKFWDIKIFQIKQKFGSLECYADYPEGMSDQINKIIGFAQGQAQLTCEGCSCVGKFEPTKGWISILCNECKEKK